MVGAHGGSEVEERSRSSGVGAKRFGCIVRCYRKDLEKDEWEVETVAAGVFEGGEVAACSGT